MPCMKPKQRGRILTVSRIDSCKRQLNVREGWNGILMFVRKSDFLNAALREYLQTLLMDSYA